MTEKHLFRSLNTTWNADLDRMELVSVPLFGQGSRFLVVGVLNTCVGVGTFYLLLWLGFHYLIALTLSHIVGVTHSYIWNRRWTFRSSAPPARELPKFLTVYGVTYVVNFILLVALVEGARIPPAIAQLVALFVTTVISFLSHKFWSFRAGA